MLFGVPPLTLPRFSRCSSVSSTRCDRGASMAEFALVTPLLIALLFSIIEFGIAFNRAQAVEAAAREGARLASLSTTTFGDVQTRVDEALTGIPMDGPVTVTVTPTGCLGREGEAVTVLVTTDHNVTVPLVLNTNVTLTGQAVFRCEA